MAPARLQTGLRLLVALLNRSGLGPLCAELSGDELRRAGLRRVRAALAALRVHCDYAIFGHTHRAGPLPGEIRREWTAPTGARLLNTGCWVHEPSSSADDPARSPYRAGFCVPSTTSAGLTPRVWRQPPLSPSRPARQAGREADRLARTPAPTCSSSTPAVLRRG